MLIKWGVIPHILFSSKKGRPKNMRHKLRKYKDTKTGRCILAHNKVEARKILGVSHKYGMNYITELVNWYDE